MGHRTDERLHLPGHLCGHRFPGPPDGRLSAHRSCQRGTWPLAGPGMPERRPFPTIPDPPLPHRGIITANLRPLSTALAGRSTSPLDNDPRYRGAGASWHRLRIYRNRPRRSARQIIESHVQGSRYDTCTKSYGEAVAARARSDASDTRMLQVCGPDDPESGSGAPRPVSRRFHPSRKSMIESSENGESVTGARSAA